MPTREVQGYVGADLGRHVHDSRQQALHVECVAADDGPLGPGEELLFDVLGPQADGVLEAGAHGPLAAVGQDGAPG
eukprot:scaffold306123_cov34-Prasinocladus_malaysianus.AAC.1